MTAFPFFSGRDGQQRPDLFDLQFGAFTMAVPITYRVIRSKRDFDGIEPAWTALHDAARGSFLSHAFLSSWLHTFGKDARCEVRTAWQGDRLVGALPLSAAGPPRALVPAGEGRIGIAGALLAPNLAAPLDVLGRLLATPLGRYLRIEPVELAEATLMVQAARQAGLNARLRRTFIAQSVTFHHETFEPFLATLSKNTRRAYTRAKREFADIQVRESTGRDGRIADDYADAARHSWKSAAGTGITATPLGHDFLRRLAEQARPGSLRISASFQGDTPVCCSFAMIDDGVLYLQAYEFNEAFSGAGRYCLLDSVRWSVENGLRECDFMRSSSVNESLANTERGLYRVVVSRRGDPTRLLRKLEGARRKLRQTFSSKTVSRAGVMSK